MNSECRAVNVSFVFILLFSFLIFNNVYAENMTQFRGQWSDMEYITTEPTNPDTTPEARAVLNFLYSIYGNKMLTGQMESGGGNPDSEINYLLEKTGKIPAIRGLDFISEADNENVVNRAIDWWQRGGIPTIMWHWGAPTVGEGYEASKGTIDVERALTPGTEENKVMMADLDRIAGHLKKLEKAGVPIIWRPLHEVNGGWFWWSKNGPGAAIDLWCFMYDYFTDDWDLDNLIWVYGYTDKPQKGWYPGDEYVDLIGADTYDQGYVPPSSMFTRAQKIVGPDSPIVYHECGPMPDPEVNFEKGMTWAWFMNWHTSWLYDQSVEHIKEVYNSDLTITLDELPDILRPVLGSPPEVVEEISTINRDISEKTWSLEYKLDEMIINPDGEGLQFSVKNSNNDLLELTLDKDNTLTIDYKAGKIGDAEISVKAETKSGRSISESFYVHIINPAVDDLAKYRPVEVSSTENNDLYRPKFINDGDNNTAWHSVKRNNEWIIVDLAKKRLVNRVMLNWGKDYAEEFSFAVSNDKKNWKTVHKEDKNSTVINLFRFDSVPARYIKLDLNKQSNHNGFSIKQLTVFGDRI